MRAAVLVLSGQRVLGDCHGLRGFAGKRSPENLEGFVARRIGTYGHWV